MAKRQTVEDRIEAYRLKQIDQDLDDLLAECEAEIYTLRRQIRVLEKRATAIAPAKGE